MTERDRPKRCPNCEFYVDPRDEGICGECCWPVYGSCIECGWTLPNDVLPHCPNCSYPTGNFPKMNVA